ncbi:hypothetical protein GCM10027048_20610 [Hymenobacter coalescens]
MNYRLRLPFIVLGWLLTAGLAPTALLAQSQDILLPLPADPSRARAAATLTTTAQRGTAATLTLPFFEDFAGQPEGPPARARWKSGSTLVNERFSQTPPSRGMATFDGLDSLGRPYGLSSGFGPTDEMTSQAIDLSAVRPGDRTYLSFFWQAGSIVGPPNDERPSRQVRLELEFLDNTGAWNRVWYQASQGFRTRFRQRFIPVNEARYLHANFRFRFRSRGNLFGTRDTWNIDYLLLDRNRDTVSVSYADLVLSAPLSSLLKRYTAMPSWQYNAAPDPTLELNDSAATTINNLDTLGVQTPYTYRGIVRVLPSGPARQFVTGSPSSQSGDKQKYVGGSLRTTPLSIPTSATPTRVEHSINLTLLASSNPVTAPNDTVRRVTEFGNYFAYDDGSAEGTTILRQGSNLPTARALRFDLNRPDQVLKLRYYYAGATAGGGATVPPTAAVTFSVWDVAPNGEPAATPKATFTENLPTTVTAPGYREVAFSQPVPVSGSFFVGYSQPAGTSLFIQFGADLNSRQPRRTFYDRENNAWTPLDPRVPLVPIIRPVMSGIVTSARNSAANAALKVYPNPSTGLVRVQGRYTQATALDALGRTVWQQPADQAGHAELDLRQLPTGLYLLRLTLPDGAVSTQRLILRP